MADALLPAALDCHPKRSTEPKPWKLLFWISERGGPITFYLFAPTSRRTQKLGSELSTKTRLVETPVRVIFRKHLFRVGARGP
jgi:hypothetical protein